MPPDLTLLRVALRTVVEAGELDNVVGGGIPGHVSSALGPGCEAPCDQCVSICHGAFLLKD